MNTEDFQRKITVILSADVEGYSRLMGDDEDSTVKTLTAYRKLMSNLIERYRGRVVDSPGDNILAEFGSVRDAVRCAVEIQEELRIRNAEQPENRKMRFRIGINLGDVIEEGDRIYGDGINVAARVEGLAEGGGISISGTVYDSIKNKLSISYESQGEHTVKNIKDPVRVYRIVTQPVTDSEIVEEKKIGLRTWQRAALIVSVVLIFGAAPVWYFFFRQGPVGTDVPEEQKTIAVLRFEDISPEKDQEYFVEGLSEELLNSLAKLPGLGVAARTSSFALKGSTQTIQEKAGILGVDHILEGSVRKAGKALRITAQLIRASDGFHMWSETYDRELKDIFEVQEDIAKAVAEKLKATFGIGAFKQLGGTENANAYELYLNAKGQYNNLKKDHGRGSIDAAILLDPEFALAYAFKAQIHNHLSQFEPDNRVTAILDMGLKAAQKAVELEPKLAEAHFAVGIIDTAKGKWIEAEQAFQKAIELATDPSSRHEVQFPDHYMCVGRFKKAEHILEEQLKVDPVNIRHHASYIEVLLNNGDRERAIEQNKKAKELLGDEWIGEILFNLPKFALSKKEEEIDTSDPFAALQKINVNALDRYFMSKELEEIHELVKDGKDDSLSIGKLASGSMLAASEGEPEFAMDLIQKAGIKRVGVVTDLWAPVYHEVRQLPRFKEFVREIGLVDYWKEYGWPDFCHPIGEDDFEC
jgi:adenylate cyclase